MKLSSKEADHFFSLMWRLQRFAGQRLGMISPETTLEEYARSPQEQKLEVRNALFDQRELIADYVEQNPDGLSRDDLAVIRSWEHAVIGEFFLERMLKKYAIFIKDDDVYGVLALHDTFEDFFDPRELPVYLRTVLLPYKGRIIYDGLMQGYRIYFGGNISRELKETYMAAKQAHRLITSLEDGEIEPFADSVILDDWTADIEQLQTAARRLRASKDSPAIWSSAFSLVRASLDLAERAARSPDDLEELWEAAGKVERALNKVTTVLNRAERFQ